MEAPNKLFIKPEKIKVEMIPGGELPNVGIQYIRKDLLLEWLNNEVERYNDKLIQSSNNKEEAIQIASSISSLLRVIAKLETL